MATTNLTAVQLLKAFRYKPLTGEFFSISSGLPVGSTRKDGYVIVRLAGRTMYAHRAAWAMMTGEFPCGHIDHINGSRSDNRWENLRVVSVADNNRNLRCAKRTNKCGLLGANFHKKSQRWRAQIRLNHATIHIGYFDTAEAAHAAYLVRKRELHRSCTI